MSDFETTATLRRPILGAFKALAPALVIAAGCMMAAAPSQATTYVLQNGAMDTPRTVNIQGIGNVYATPVQFDGYIDDVIDTPFINLVAFCVDVYHHISLGNYNPDLTYTDTIPLTTDSNVPVSAPLSAGAITQIGRLVNYGTNVFYNAPNGGARFDELAVVQSAIWEVVSGKNVTFNGNAILDARITALSGAGYLSAFNPIYGPVSSNITLLTPFKGTVVYPDSRLTQSFAIAAVPEPATWAMMIMGFGAAGAVLRRSRRQMAVAI